MRWLRLPDSAWSKSDRGTGSYLVKTLAIDPRDSSHLLAGAGGDGIYVSRDGGASWSASSAGLAAGWAEKLWGDARSGTLFAQMASGLYRRDGSNWVAVVLCVVGTQRTQVGQAPLVTSQR